MKKFLLLSILLSISNLAFSQWDDETESVSKKKQDESTYIKSVESSDYNNYSQPSNDTPVLAKDAKEALITNFDAALQRRLYAMKSTAEHEESYWEIMESYYHFLRNSYDKNLYNVIAINDQVWVEPQYITAMFNGSDPAQGVNDYIEVLFKGKKLEAKKKAEKKSYNYDSYIVLGVGIGFATWYGSWWWNHPWYYWGGWGPWGPGPWGPYNPWWGPGPWGPYHPWYNPWPVGPVHPVYYGNGVRRGGGMFSPSPSLRSPGISPKGSGAYAGGFGNPFGRSVGSSYQPLQTKGKVPQTQGKTSGNRNYRNNYNSGSRPNNGSGYRSFSGGGASHPSFGGGGGGFHSIGGGGYRR